MVMKRGEVWWADLDEPAGSEPGFRRPALIVQTDWMLTTRLGTVVVIPITSNVRLADAPGNVLIQPRDSGLPKPSVVNVSQIAAVDRSMLVSRCGRLPPAVLRAVEQGLRLVLEL
jgi:mRNA interferase MazF